MPLSRLKRRIKRLKPPVIISAQKPYELMTAQNVNSLKRNRIAYHEMIPFGLSRSVSSSPFIPAIVV